MAEVIALGYNAMPKREFYFDLCGRSIPNANLRFNPDFALDSIVILIPQSREKNL